MTFMPWSDAIAVGIEEGDAQHRVLVDLINELHDALTADTLDRGAIGHVLEGLMDYTMNHFIMEEEWFERHNYPDLLEHEAMHNHFTSTIMSALTDFEDGQHLPYALMEFLKHWLLEHIMRTDKTYVPFLQAHGIT